MEQISKTCIEHAKRHGSEAHDAWESGFFYGAAFALEERLYDQWQESHRILQQATKYRSSGVKESHDMCMVQM